MRAAVRQLLKLPVIEVDPMGIGDISPHKPALLHQFQRPASINFKTEFIFISGFRQVRMQPNAVLARQLNRLAQQCFADGKRAAGRQNDFAHSQRTAVVKLPDDPFTICENFIFCLHHTVGRQSPILLAQGHGTPPG